MTLEIKGSQLDHAQAEQVPVWDLFVRLFHWTLVAAISVAALTGFVLGASWIRVHIVSAVLAVVLVTVRVIWGLFGPTFARFSSFVVLHPEKLRAHLDNLRGGKAPRYIGHNPLGALMVLALLLTILALGLTGTMLLGGVYKTGPFIDDLPYWLGWLSGVFHQLLAFGLLAMIALHIGGVIFESRREGENLARAMVTGKKTVAPGNVVAPQKPALVLPAIITAVLLVGGGAYWALVSSNEPPELLDGNGPRGMPVAEAQFDPVFAEECSACHMAYNPSLLPAEDWKKLMAGLDSHFGEDASLDDASTSQITDWLVANAAETADTRPAHLFSLPRKADGTIGAITDSKVWRELHDTPLENGAFKVKSVGSEANCQACHTDAVSGVFSPFNIKLPKE